MPRGAPHYMTGKAAYWMAEKENNGRMPKPKERVDQGLRRGPGRVTLAGERVAIFIDGSNLYNGMRENLRNTRVNLAELIQQLLRDRPLFRTYYYNAPLTEDYDEELREGQARFFDSLRRIPYVTVRFGKLHRRPDGAMVEKGIDVAIAVEALSLAYQDAYDTALLVSGDGDYVELVEAIKRLGKHVECAMFRNQSAGTLLEHVDLYQNLDELDWSRIVF